MPRTMYISYGIISLVITIVASFHGIARLGDKRERWMPEGTLSRLIVGLALTGLLLIALSSLFDYFAFYMYITERAVRISPQMSSQVIIFQAIRILIITLAYIIVLVNGWRYGTRISVIETAWDKITWGLFLLGIGRIASEPILLIVQIVQEFMYSGFSGIG